MDISVNCGKTPAKRRTICLEVCSLHSLSRGYREHKLSISFQNVVLHALIFSKSGVFTQGLFQGLIIHDELITNVKKYELVVYSPFFLSHPVHFCLHLVSNIQSTFSLQVFFFHFLNHLSDLALPLVSLSLHRICGSIHSNVFFFTCSLASYSH